MAGMKPLGRNCYMNRLFSLLFFFINVFALFCTPLHGEVQMASTSCPKNLVTEIDLYAHQSADTSTFRNELMQLLRDFEFVSNNGRYGIAQSISGSYGFTIMDRVGYEEVEPIWMAQYLVGGYVTIGYNYINKSEKLCGNICHMLFRLSITGRVLA